MSQNSKPTSPVSRLGGMGQWIRPLVFASWRNGTMDTSPCLCKRLHDVIQNVTNFQSGIKLIMRIIK